MLLLALPGSAYLYQGEELGLPEVADIPFDALEDPIWERHAHTEKGRDGTRVPIPWTVDGPSFGFGAGGSHLPQPDWFAGFAVEVEDADPDSTLNLYRSAVALRARLTVGEGVAFADDRSHVIEALREGGWRSVTAFGQAAALPDGEILLASAPVGDDRWLPADATAWIRDPS
jgi:alpha-glucosidase